MRRQRFRFAEMTSVARASTNGDTAASGVRDVTNLVDRSFVAQWSPFASFSLASELAS
jgi:hypothetical protein